MGTDFFPRLTAAATDPAASNRMINEQIETGVLIAFPGVLATLVLAPLVLHLAYAPSFSAASEVIRWQILGVGLKVISWPLGLVALAKGRSALFVKIEVSFAVLQAVLLYVCLKWFKLEGAGIAVFIHYALYTAGISLVARKLTGFSWARSCLWTLLAGFAFAVSAFVLCRYSRPEIATPAGLLLTVAGGWWSLSRLRHLLGKDFLATVIKKISNRFSGKRTAVRDDDQT
jgi:PST family polysaccharide transporter